jgi:hypothetical protein
MVRERLSIASGVGKQGRDAAHNFGQDLAAPLWRVTV